MNIPRLFFLALIAFPAVMVDAQNPPAPVLPAAGTKMLHGHVPEPARRLTAASRLAATNELRLAIGLPLRDPAGLEKFLAEVYDPASTNYHRYLALETLTARFGPTLADYESVKNFARTNGFQITVEHGNRLS